MADADLRQSYILSSGFLARHALCYETWSYFPIFKLFKIGSVSGDASGPDFFLPFLSLAYLPTP